MGLLERAPLLEELGGVLAATAVGGRVVLVAGEAGIGKSALVRQFTERHAADARFLLGACDPLLTPGRWGRCTTSPASRGGGWPSCWRREARGRSCSPRCWTSWTGRRVRR